ncbi:zona pellucida sperm-binding 2-like isoform X2 [Labeo rohita]|uniref:Zona pellucida sperm-binding 2-like isoform X2 n=1 Tax=Labeo rohita TaxID=84645 RepID=A0A498MXT9_LABRO|nr:zona pellucida sperm-binding 2-like isoform X2 [Labeo rohita]
MGCFEIGALWVMVTIISIHADTSADGIQAECLGNRVQFILPGSLSAGSPLEVYAVNNTQTVLLTPHLAAQCGYTQKSDPWGNTIVSASLQSCFAENQVSVRNAIPEIKTAPVNQWPTVIPNLQLWKVLLYSPGEKAFDKETLQAMGYNVYSSPTRLVMRSPYNMAENFVQNVDGVDMMVFKSVVLFRDRWMMTIVESAAACPISGASVVGQMISWHVPRHISPLVSSEVEILEVHMGVNGRTLTPEEMGSRHYAMTFTESHIVVKIPIGAPDGYYKSYVLKDQYHVSYTIEPMLELLWKEGLDKTTYKVLFPITTPLTPWPLQVTDYTQPKQKVFDILLGYFLPDVELLNITFGSELLTVSEVLIKGIGLQEHSFPNDTKAFALQVPFSEPHVQIKSFRPDVRTYSLPLVFGFIILPEHTLFSYSTVLEASTTNIVLPNAGGSCEQEHFKMYVKYGSTPSSQLKIKLGHMELNDKILQQYEHHSNETHFFIIVPFLAPVVAFELTGITARIDVEIFDSLNNWSYKEISLACPFFLKLSECFSNGTINVVLPKLESVPNLHPDQLSLRDPACKPYYNEDYFAYFHFDVTTCGTTRKFVGDTMVYENEVTWKRDGPLPETLPPEKEYRCANPKDPEQTIFHPVIPDDRVDIPDHFKRFEVKTFSFKEDYGSSKSEDATLARRVFVHCDVIICHVDNTADGRCYKQCGATRNTVKSSSNRVRRRSSPSEEALQHVSIGPILFI